jgi:pimeloyl-ACP methyl ester carboxylesterase
MPSLDRNGISLWYEEVTGSKIPIVLVHGWCCDHTYLAPQFEHFAAVGHRVVAVDLRGHGRSDKPEQAYTMPVFAEDLLWLCEQLTLERPIVIGHSMGGIVAFAMAARHPSRVAAIAMLDAAIVLPAGARSAIPDFLVWLRGPDYLSAIREYVGNALFLPSDDPERKTWILDGMAAAPQHVMVSAFEGLRDYDPAEAEGGLAVPSLYIAADEPVSRSDLARFQALTPQTLYGRTVGSGHFLQLEVPDQVNAMIGRFLAVSSLSRCDAKASGSAGDHAM